MSELLYGEELLSEIVAKLNPRDDKGDTYQTIRDILIAAVHDREYGFYAFQWIDYKAAKADGGAAQWRLKLNHDIRLTNGREYLAMRPNADSWHGNGGQFKDAQVT